MQAREVKTIEDAIEIVLADRDVKTPDLGGRATTEEMGRAIAEVAARHGGKS
jgi:isocitrate/isopropylmalate dehydrogenase